MNRLIAIVLFYSLLACAPQHCPIELTRGGKLVPLLDAVLVTEIPGHPLDKCSVLAQINLSSINNRECWVTNNDLNNALRNRTAEMMGNVAIFVKYDFDLIPISTIRGMSLFCQSESLKSAGITDMIQEFVKLDSPGYNSRSRSNSNADDQDNADSGKKGSRRRYNSD